MKQELQFVRLDTYKTILQLARKHRSEGLSQMAEDLYKQAIAVARVLNEPEPILLSSAIFELASYYEFQAKEDLSETLWRELKAYEEYFTANHYIYVQSILSLAKIKEKRTDLTSAEELYKELLKKQEREFGDESLEICATLDCLADFYCRQGKFNMAESILLRILVIKEFYLGTCSPEINYTVDALISIFKKLQKWRLAEYMINRQKGILLALHGKNSLCVASCAIRLAELQIATNQINRAIDNLSEGIQIFRSRFGALAAPVVALQNRLDTLLIYGLELNFSPPTDSTDTSEEPITVNLDSVLTAENAALITA